MKHVFLLAALLALVACGADEESLDAGPDPDGSTDGGDITLDPPVPPRPLTIAVTDDSDGAPVEGATVAVDRPDGTRVELITDASGEVELEPIDWWAGDVVVTVYREGYRMRTWVLDEAPDDNTLDSPLKSLSPPAPVDTVTVSGTIQNGLPEESDPLLFVNAYVSGATAFDERETRWSIQVPRDTRFPLAAIQYDYGRRPEDCHAYDFPRFFYALVEHPAVSEPTTVVIDFEAHGVTPQTVSGSFDIPTRADTPMADFGFGVAAMNGFPASRMRFNPTARRYEYENESFAEMNEVSVMGVHEGCDYQLSTIEGQWAWTTAIVGQTGAEGHKGRVLDIPEWLVEPSCDGRHPIEEPIAWETWEGEENIETIFWVAPADRDSVWQVNLPGDHSPFTLPEPPSTASLEEMLGSAPVIWLSTQQPRPDLGDGSYAQANADEPLPLTLSCQ